DGIRDFHVTGVQTCALPISLYLPPVPQDAQDSGRVILRDGSTAMLRVSREEDAPLVAQFVAGLSPESRLRRFFTSGMPGTDQLRSEERRVGEEGGVVASRER